MTRFFCGMWEYKTQILDYKHTESFLARLLLKKRRLYVCICDESGNPVAGVRKDTSNVYNLDNHLCVAGLVLYNTYYIVKIDSLENVYLVPIH